MVVTIFALFALAAVPLFRLAPPASAVAITCFAGWLLLPVGNFPPGSAESSFAYWITGAAVPSDMLLTKMWWPPVVALVGALWSDRKSVLRWRLRWNDVPMILWCLWPIGQWPFVAHPEPSPWVASLYLAAAWGAPWVLGRIYFSGQQARVQLITAIAAGLAVLVPIALLEGIIGPKLYGWLYELHPFRFDGAQRYIGFRPLGFFEHGNQYGIWVAATALAAVWLWRTEPDAYVRGRFGTVAALAVAITLLSQSVGAILLLFGGLALLWKIGSPMKRWVLPLMLALIVSGATLYLTRALPLRAFAENTMIGRQIVGLARSAGRESFTWRIARDQEALALFSDHPIAGTGQWDWWRQDEGRPWDLTVLILGQFGLIGLVLALGSLLAPAVRALYDGGCLALRRNLPEVPLATIVLMGVADMLLNSFILYPAILAAGALGQMKKSKLEQGTAGQSA
jgi:hypothetical protein